jgi:hypothetical protein
METDEKRIDAANAFAEFKALLLAERELAEHKFTLDEVNRLRAEAAGDIDGLKRWNALHPAIAASNERGDYREPFQMSPKEYAEYAGAIDRPVYTLADVHDIMQAVGASTYETANSPDARAWREELDRAQREGRIMVGPGGGEDPRPFADETDDQRTKRVQAYGTTMALSVAVRTKLSDVLAQVRELESKETEADVIRSHVLTAANRIAPHVRETVGLAFDVRGSAEFKEFDAVVSKAGGLRSWKFDD